MKYLIDTHILLWSTTDSQKLSVRAKAILSNPDNVCYFSAASIWEIAIKRARHPDMMPIPANEARKLFLDAGYRELLVSSVHSAEVEGLPPIHSDPFDRMLVAQAQVEGMRIATHDHVLPDYGDFVDKV